MIKRLYWFLRYTLERPWARLQIEGTDTRFLVTSQSEFTRVKKLRGEREVLSVLLRHTRSTDVVYDIGSFIGTHALPLASKAQQVHAYDPNVTAVAQMMRSAEANVLVNIYPHKEAVRANFDFQAPPPQVVKIDIEGDELFAIAALSRYLPGVRAICVEAHSELLRKGVIHQLKQAQFNLSEWPRGPETHIIGLRA